MKRAPFLAWLPLACALAACSGGGGGGSGTVVVPTPTPDPAPAPVPTPAPTDSAFDTAEYRATEGAVAMNALAAYQRGATGAGIKVAVIDTGIDIDRPEFAGRIDPASRDVAGNGTVDDVGGHGTGVSLLLAARRDGSGTHGVAFDATIVAFRADFPGTCAAGDCVMSLAATAQAIDLARAAGVRVINLSMIGDNPPGAAMLEALDRATAVGIVVAVCAGNDGGPEPARFGAGLAASAQARGLVIVVGGVGRDDMPFTSRAGASAAHYLTANAGSCSAATPQVAGAAVLIAQANPGMSGADIVATLYASARDAGAAGQDPVHGRGVLDLTAAFR